MEENAKREDVLNALAWSYQKLEAVVIHTKDERDKAYVMKKMAYCHSDHQLFTKDVLDEILLSVDGKNEEDKIWAKKFYTDWIWRIN